MISPQPSYERGEIKDDLRKKFSTLQAVSRGFHDFFIFKTGVKPLIKRPPKSFLDFLTIKDEIM